MLRRLSAALALIAVLSAPLLALYCETACEGGGPATAMPSSCHQHHEATAGRAVGASHRCDGHGIAMIAASAPRSAALFVSAARLASGDVRVISALVRRLAVRDAGPPRPPDLPVVLRI